jgi:hypothetical protein
VVEEAAAAEAAMKNLLETYNFVMYTNLKIDWHKC